MIRNEYAILRNGDTIFKSQVVDSYLCINSTANNTQFIYADGLSASNSLDIYYVTPTEVIKCCNTSDLQGNTLLFPATSESSYKDFYYCGALENVTAFRADNYYNNGCYSGDLICFMNQFPNLESLCLIQREADFNQDISYRDFPENLTEFRLFDRGITGDLTTVKNFESIKELQICYTPFTGNIGTIGNDFSCFDVRYTSSSLQYCINDLVNNSTCLSNFSSFVAQGVSLCADTLDFSDFQCFYMYGPYTDVKGNVSGWTFNTGLTCIYSTSYYLGGDISNWDFSNTELRGLALRNYQYSITEISGDLSNWSFPSEFNYLCLYGGCGVTCLPENFSGTSLSTFSIYRYENITNDLNDFNFGDSLTYLNLQYTSMVGNLENFSFPSGATTYYINYNCLTGNLSGISVCDNTCILDLNGNDISGNLVDFNMPTNICRLSLSYNTGVTLNLSSSGFNTNNLRYFYLDGISGITGSFNNFTTGNNLDVFRAANTTISAALNDFDVNNLICFVAYNSNINQDVTTFLSGATGLTGLCMERNPNMSGDTTGLDFSLSRTFSTYSTALSGSMCHFNICCLNIYDTNISSDIENDFDFSSAHNVRINNTNIYGHLSGITHDFNIYYFNIYSNPNIYGSNEYTDYIFTNRKNFTYNQVFLGYYNIGDTVSGTSETLGDLGTYIGDPSGMDLTEEQVNNLVDGTDYDGLGTNTPWDGKNKVWWMENACVSSSSTSKRYTNFYITYS